MEIVGEYIDLDLDLYLESHSDSDSGSDYGMDSSATKPYQDFMRDWEE